MPSSPSSQIMYAPVLLIMPSLAIKSVDCRAERMAISVRAASTLGLQTLLSISGNSPGVEQMMMRLESETVGFCTLALPKFVGFKEISGFMLSKFWWFLRYRLFRAATSVFYPTTILKSLSMYPIVALIPLASPEEDLTSRRQKPKAQGNKRSPIPQQRGTRLLSATTTLHAEGGRVLAPGLQQRYVALGNLALSQRYIN